LHDIRIYDPIDNYITKCSKCHKFGYIRTDCKEKDQICPRCTKRTAITVTQKSNTNAQSVT